MNAHFPYFETDSETDSLIIEYRESPLKCANAQGDTISINISAGFGCVLAHWQVSPLKEDALPRAGRCPWPLAQGWCNGARSGKKVYCADHAKLAYQAPKLSKAPQR